MKILIVTFLSLFLAFPLGAKKLKDGWCLNFVVFKLKPGEAHCEKASLVYPRLKCTRKKGHRGKHHAHGTTRCFDVWK